MRLLLFALLASGLTFGQSVKEFQRKYGAEVSETFRVRAGLGVRIRNGSKGRIAELLIVPVHADTLIQSRNITFSVTTGKDVLGELLPLPKRGKLVMTEFVNAICQPENDCAGSSEEYENVNIVYNYSTKQEFAGRLCYIDVRFKR